MVGMDSWCPSCGYSVEPGTRFCGGCGQQLAAEGGVPAVQSPTVTAQSPAGPFHGQTVPAALPAPVAPSAGATSPAAPPPPAGAPAPFPPPPADGSQAAGPPPPLSDTMERMLRPQGLFQHRLPAPAEWQQPYPPAPGAYPPGGQYPQGPQYPPAPQYPQGSPYPPPPGAPYPPGAQYPAAGAFQQSPPQSWGQAPTSVGPAGPGQPGAGYQPDGQYPQSGAYQGPYGNGQYPGGQFGQDQYPGGQFGPGVQYGPDGMPVQGGGPLSGAAGGQGLLGKLPVRLPKGRVVPVTVAVAAVIVVVVALTLSSQGGSSSNSPTAGTAVATTPTASASAGTTALTEQQAASSLSGLLQQSGGDRADVSDAVVDVEGCGNSLPKDAQVFDKAAANRSALLAKLAQLPGRSALSPAMLSALTSAWQASATVDADLGKWAQDQVGHCKKGNTKDPNYTATIPFDSKATNSKNAFVQLWNPLAKKDGLPTRKSSDL